VRNVTVALIVVNILGFCGSASARDITLPKYTADQVKSACTKAGGSFSQYAEGYGCGTDCHGKAGTDCTVDCKTGQRCFAQVIGGRRPRDIAGALQQPERKR